ncbi:NAD(P)-dependent alcohol dehydrogenase [Roseimaritima ulvae]|uniref:Zinc-type alcohol dehydrogenase-like protein n=1 Tax=Roseimaritima ulvae TaxID=980254 RepID=A0A5B9R0C5_9BACT|nr:NAD(P)-dependent alcohol dehydrogenase [Roseimaritima ulvae]QEG43175.1 Zinc-type alcohol dehydrogenase-like protein [Roseimaritima ulvae]
MSTKTPDSTQHAIETESQTMRAVVYEDYGDPSQLQLAEISIPRRITGEVLIEVYACSVNPIDYRLRRGEMKGVLPGGFPRVPGYDVAGVVVDGEDGGPLKPGDRVMAFLTHSRGGACAEYASCAVDAVAKLPASMSMEIAAAMPLAGTTALQSLRDHGKMQAGEHVLVNGASGGVGMFAVQIAKAYGCTVSAVASGHNKEFCLSLGADQFYDYEHVDFTELNQHWDIVFDAAGKSGYWDSRSVMNEGARYVSTEPDIQGMLMTVLTWPFSKSGTVMLAKPKADDLEELIRLHEAGQLNVTIDSRFDLAHTAEAHRRIESGVDHGKVVITVKPAEAADRAGP